MMQKLMLPFIFFTLLLSLLFTTLSAKESFISGVASYTNEELLPADAQLEVVLEDISLLDTMAVTIGETTINPAGQIPIPFKITFDDEKIELGHRYAVRAKIIHKGKLL